MKRYSYAAFLTFAALACASLAMAAETNFSPANMSGNQPAVETKRPAAAAPKNTEPTFWDREAERSGLSTTGGNFKSGLTSFFHLPDWFKKKEDEYRQRHPQSDR